MSWYRTGTVELTNGSPLVVGTGTDFVANVRAGFAFNAPDGVVYEVLSIVSVGVMTLVTPYHGSTVSGAEYSVTQTQSIIAELSAQAAALLSSFDASKSEAAASAAAAAQSAAILGVALPIPGYAAAAEAAAGTATTQAALAHDWATKTTSEVVGGQGYGAKKYADDAAAAAAGANMSAVTAASQAGIAVTQANSAIAAFDSFDDRYLGAKATEPALDNDGAALLVGAIYFDTLIGGGSLRAWNGTNWVTAPVANASAVVNTPAGTIAATTVQAALNELDGEKQAVAAKDAAGGYAGLTAFKLNLRNAANTITSWVATAATVARTWTMPDKDGTVAMLSDITAAAVGLSLVSNTGDADKPISTATAAALALKSPLISPSFTSPTVDSINGGSIAGMKNKIVNGAMQFDQQNGGAALAIALGAPGYPCDQWYVSNGRTNGSTLVGQQVASPFAGFSHALQLTNTAAGAIAASDAVRVAQAIEGFNISDLMWGTASAKSIAVSFWVVSTITGTFSAAVSNSGATRSYVQNFSLVANVKTRVSLTVPGDTSGTWLTANNIGLILTLALGVGPNYQTAVLNAWQSGFYLGSSTATPITTTAGASITITGVQLIVGTVDTPFEYSVYPLELIRCQRYWEPITMASSNNPSTQYQAAYWKTTKRATPTLTQIQMNGGGGSSVVADLLTTTQMVYQSSAPTGTGTLAVYGSARLL